MSTKHIGDIGENIAEKYLKKRFWHILSRNYNVRGGEIDIIAYRFGVLAYFEVKSRSTDEFGRPADAVDAEKIAKIKCAARNFLATYSIGGRIPVFYPFDTKKMRNIRKQRIDVIEIFLTRDHRLHRLNHIKDWEQL